MKTGEVNINVVALELTAADLRESGQSFAAAQMEMAASLLTKADQKAARLESDERRHRAKAKQYAKLAEQANQRATSAEYALSEAMQSLSVAAAALEGTSSGDEVRAAISCIDAGCMTVAERQARATTIKRMLSFIRNRAGKMTTDQIANEIERTFYRKRVGV